MSDTSSLRDIGRARFRIENLDGQTTDRVLVVYWEGIPSSLINKAAEEERSERRSVVSPRVDNQPFSGTWRSWKVSVSGSTLEHRFLYGWIQSLVTSGTLSYDEARLVDSKNYSKGALAVTPGGNTSEDWHQVEWRGIDPTKIETIKASIYALAVSSFNLTINGETYGNGLHRLLVASKIEEDGSATLSLFLGSPEFTLNVTQSIFTRSSRLVTYHWNVPKELAQAVSDAETGAGSTTRADYDNARGVVNMVVSRRNYTIDLVPLQMSGIRCDSIEYTAQYLGIPTYSAYPIPTSPVPRFEYQREVRSDGDGGYDITVSATYRRPREMDPRVSQYGYDGQRVETVQLGIYSEAVPNINVLYRGYEYSQSREINRDCTSTYVTQAAYAFPQASYDAKTGSVYAETETTSQFSNYSTRPEVPDPIRGVEYRAESTLNRVALYDGRIVAQSAVPVGIYGVLSGSSYSENVYADFYQNSYAQPIGSSAARGEETRSNVSVNRLGLYDGTVQRVSATPVGVYGVLSGSFYSENTYLDLYQNSYEQPIQGEAPRGQEFRSDLTVNRLGLYDASLRRSSAVPVGVYGVLSGSQYTVLAYSDFYQNSYEQPINGVAARGEATSADLNVNRLGLYDGRVNRESAIPAAVYATIAGSVYVENAYDDLYINSYERPTLGYAPRGVEYIERFDLNRFGLYDGSLRSVVPVYVEVKSLSIESRPFGAAYRSQLRNADSPTNIPRASAGSLYERALDVTRLGLYDESTTYRVFDPRVCVQRSAVSPLSYRYTVRYSDYTDQIALGDAEQGRRAEGSMDLSQIGRYDGVYSYEALLPAGYEFDSGYSALDYEKTSTYVNYAFAPAIVGALGAEASGRFDITEAGQYAGGIRVTYARPFVAADKRTLTGALLYSETSAYVNYPTIPDITATGRGVSSSVGIDTNRFGYYSSRMVHEYAQPGGFFFLSDARLGQYRVDATGLNALEYASASRQPGAIISADARFDEKFGVYGYSLRSTYFSEFSTGEFSASVSPLSVTSRNIYGNSANPVERSITSAPGRLFEQDSRLNEASLYDNAYSVTTAYPVSAYSQVSAGALSNAHAAIYENAGTLPVAQAVAGAIVEGGFRYNRFGYLDGELRTTLAVPSTFTFSSRSDFDSSGKEYKAQNIAGSVSVPDAERGTAYSADFSANRFGLYDGSVLYETARTGTSWEWASEDGPTREERSIGYSSSADPISSPDSGPGFRYAGSSAINRFGYYNGVLQYQVAVPITFGAESARTILGAVYEIGYANSEAMISPMAVTPGYTSAASMAVNEFGYYNGSARLSYSFEKTIPLTTLSSALVDSFALEYSASRSPISAPDCSYGNEYTASSRISEDGTYGGTVAYSQARLSVSTICVPSDGMYVYSGKVLNYVGDPQQSVGLLQIPEDYTKLSLSHATNRDGSYDVSASWTLAGDEMLVWKEDTVYNHFTEFSSGADVYVYTIFTRNWDKAKQWSYGVGCPVPSWGRPVGIAAGNRTGITISSDKSFIGQRVFVYGRRPQSV